WDGESGDSRFGALRDPRFLASAPADACPSARTARLTVASLLGAWATQSREGHTFVCRCASFRQEPKDTRRNAGTRGKVSSTTIADAINAPGMPSPAVAMTPTANAPTAVPLSKHAFHAALAMSCWWVWANASSSVRFWMAPYPAPNTRAAAKIVAYGKMPLPESMPSATTIRPAPEA